MTDSRKLNELLIDFFVEISIKQDVSADEFQICINILSTTKLGTTPKGHSELVQLIIDQAELNADVDAILIEDEVVERYIQCATTALPYFSVSFGTRFRHYFRFDNKINLILQTAIESTPFVKYACEKLLPLQTWKLIGAAEGNQDQIHLRLLKVFAEMLTHCGTLENVEKHVEAIFNVLQVKFSQEFFFFCPKD